MKKLLLIPLFFLGCVSEQNINLNKEIKAVNKDKILMKKYHITSDNLIPFGKNYLFFKPSVNGSDIYILNSKFNLIKKFSTPIFLNAQKLKVYKNKIYLFGVDENSYYPVLLVFNQKGKMLHKYEIPKKYALAKDFFVDNNNVYFMIDVYKKGKSHIEIYKNNRIYKKINLNHSINGNFIFKFNNDIFVTGNIKNKTQDAFIVNLNKGWIRIFDLGMDESIIKVVLRKNKLILTLLSTDEMGANEYYEIILNINGKILKNKCKIKFPVVPSRLRT